MSVSYIFEDHVVSTLYCYPDQTYAYIGLGMDLTLLANAEGVTDSSRFYAQDLDWTFMTENAGMSFDQYFTYTCLFRLTKDAVLTIGGDYSNESNKYNLSITGTDSPYRVSAARADKDLRLVLVAQTGAAGASGNLDENISVYAKSEVSRDRKTTFKSNAPTTNDASAIGYDVAGTLVVSSDLLGNVTTITDASLLGIRVPDGDKTKAVNTSVDQRADAVAVRASALTLIRNFNANLTITSTMETVGYASLTVTGNSAAATGVRVYGDLSAKGGEWNGIITATASKSSGKAVKASLDSSVTSFSPASVSNNDFSAYGIWADGAVDIAHLHGDASKTEITALSTGNTLAAEASGDSSSISMSGNSISAYGVKGETITLDRVDDTFSISTTTTANTVTATLSGKDPKLTLSNNLIASVGIEAETLTVGSFNGKITAAASNISVTLKGFDNETATNTNYFNVSGINAKNFNVKDNLGGVITVSANKVVETALEKSASKLEVFGINVASKMNVTGRINTSITISGGGNRGPTSIGKAIIAEYLVADAFSGNMTTTLSGIATIGLQGNYQLSTGAVNEAFDVNGSISGFDCGVASLGKLNLRVSGSISADTVIAAERYYEVNSGILLEIINPNSTSDDKVEFSKTAVVTGKVELGRGTNSVVINSGATIDGSKTKSGALIATDGLMNIRFDLDETINSKAIVTTKIGDASLASTTTVSINLNNAQHDKTYTLFKYDESAKDYWMSGGKQITFSYQGQSEILNVSKAGTASASFTDAAGNVVSATLTYSEADNSVKVKIDENSCSLDDFGGALSTEFDSDKRTALLSWSDAVSAENYEVEYSVDNGKTIVVMVAGAKNSVTINGIDPGSTINWRVRGNTGDGIEVSDWSDWSGNKSYDPAVLGDPVMAAATPRAVNPDEEGGGVIAARARFTWEAATGDSEIAYYYAEFIVSKTQLTPEEVAAIYADPSSIADDESKKFFFKKTTATEVVATSLTNQSYVYWRVKAFDVDGRYSEFKDGEAFRIWVGDDVKPVWRKLADDETDAATAVVDYDRSDAYDVKLNVDFTWISAEDTQSGVKSYLLQYKLADDSWLDETKVSSVTVAENGSKTYSASLTGLKGGLYDYRIKAVDFVGNESTYLVTSQFGASDLTPPSGRFSSFSTPVVTGEWSEPNSSSNSNDSTGKVLTGVTVKLAWSDTFTDDSNIIYTVEVSDNADFIGKRIYSFETTEKSLTLDDSVGTASAVLAGMSTVYYRVSVKDDQGNVNPLPSSTQSFDMVDSSTGDTISFSPAAAEPTGLGYSKSKVAVGSSYRTNLTFKWSEGDNNFGVYDYTLSVTTGGKTTTYTGITANSYTLSNQLDGDYTWKVTANTGSGSSATASGTKFTVDATAPLFAEDATATVVTSLNDFAINWDAATDKNGVAGYVLLYGSGTDTSGWASTTVSTNSFKGSISSSGDYNYIIYAVDTYGNRSSDAQSYIAGSFSITTESHTTSDTAKTITVTDVRDNNVLSSGSVGLATTAEWLKFTIADNDSDVYIMVADVVSSYNNGSGITVKVYSENDFKKAISTTSVAKGDSKLQLRFAEAGTYYIEVTPKKSASIMSFSVAAAYNVPTAAELTQEDNAWNGYDTATGKRISAKDYAGQFRQAIAFDAETGKVEQELIDDYVGKTDTVDYRRFDVTEAGNYDFTVAGVASPLVLSIYGTTLDSLGNVASVKEVKKVTLSPKYDGKKGEWIDTVSTGELLLDKGSYYFSVTATGAKNDKNSVYDVTVAGEAFVKVNNADDDWQLLAPEYTENIAAGTAAVDIKLFADEWVGFGDTIDYRKLTIDQSGNYNFTISGASNAATLTLYTVNAKSGKLDKFKSISVDGNKKTTASTGDLLVLAGTTYYVAVTANNWKKGKNTDYEATVTGTGFVDGNNEDDDWTALDPVKYAANVAAKTATTDIRLFGEELKPEWVGYGDTIDYRKLTIDQAGCYTFTLSGASNSMTLAIYTENAKKPGTLSKVKSITVNGTKVASGEIKDLLVDAGTTYYVAVSANDAKKAKNSYYEVTLTGTGFVKANTEDDDWQTLDPVKYAATVAEGTADPTVALFADEWVGYGDAIDYRKLTIDQAGSYDFTLTGANNAVTLTIYTENAKKPGTLSKVKSITVNGTKAHDGAISGLLVDKGTTYYVEVKANDAKKGKNTDYEVNVTGTGFVKANMADDDTWQDAAAPEWGTTQVTLKYDAVGKVTNTLISDDEWVGFGDTVDYREITVDTAGQYNVNVNLGAEQNNVKLTVWSLTENNKGEKVVKQLKSITVNAAKTNVGEISGLLLDKGVYYVSVEATDAKKGKNAGYDLSITGTGFIAGNNLDDDWTTLDPKYTISGTTSFDDWVGFGDKIDYRAVSIASEGGIYSFKVSGVGGTSVENSVKLTVYTENNGKLKSVKSVTATTKNGSAETGDLCLAAGNTYYLAVEAPDAAKAKNSAYTLSMTERGTFTNLGNETWDTATEATGTNFLYNGVLTKSAGGDTTDFLSVNDYQNLAVDAANGKLKVSFLDENQKPVKLAEMTMADGSVKKNVSNLTLEADHKTNDYFLVSDLDDAVKYLKIEAAANGLNSYGLSLARLA